MPKTILITGSTDGIGLATAKRLLAQGHHVLLHGRNPDKLQRVERELAQLGRLDSYTADLSSIADVEILADNILQKHLNVDVLINNAGVLSSATTWTKEGLDVRFMVNTIAPYLLMKRLLPVLNSTSRVINLSSAAQSTVDLNTLTGKQGDISAMAAYAQSKLALTMWSVYMASILADKGPAIIAVNPGSLLATNMVKEGFGIAGKNIDIGADILTQLATSEEFADASGKYFDNDSGTFANPHADALDSQKCGYLVDVMDAILAKLTTED